MNKRSLFLVEVMLEKEINNHADLIASRIYGITGTKISGDAAIQPVTVWQIDPMDSASFKLAQSIVDNVESKNVG